MRIFLLRPFARWAKRENLTHRALLTAADEVAQGLVDATLGGGVVKKRVAMAARGKRGGARTLLAYKSGGKMFFVYGFAKNQRSNISAAELRALKALATELFSYTDKALGLAISAGELIEVTNDD